MSKHKLFIPDDCSPFNLNKSDSLITQSSKSGTSEEGLLVKNNMTTPVSKKKKPNSVEPGKKKCNLHSNPRPSTSKKTDDDDDYDYDDDDNDVMSDSGLSTVSNGFDDKVDTKCFLFNQKLPYTYQEDEMILKFVLKGQNIFRVSSLSLWKYLESKKVKPKRTYQSLKNRFLRNIKPLIFSSYSHLIDNKDTVEKILLKFPELKKQMGESKWLKEIKDMKIEKKPLALNSNLSKFENNTEDIPSTPFTEPKSVNAEQQPVTPSSVFHISKDTNTERTVTLRKNLLKVTINFNISNIPFSKMPSLCERFGKYKNSNERVPCPTCGRFYRRPVPNNSSESSEECDIPNSYPNEREENSPVITNVCSVSRKSPNNLTPRVVLPTRSSARISASQSLLNRLDKSDKSNGNSEDLNNSPVEEVTTEKDEFKIEVMEMPIKERNSEKDDKITDNDSDIDLIYEHTVERFQKLIEGDEERTSQRNCLNKDVDLIDLNDIGDKNLDSFFLESPNDVEVPSCTPQVEVSSSCSTRTQSQRVTRSSVLASNMMKMLADSTRGRRRLRK